jgi:phosphoglycerol transferase MdoB-like AlkP superfamily enzyme
MDAFILGFRYDLRTAAIIVLPVFLLSFLQINYYSHGSQNKLTAGSITRLIVAFISMIIVLLVLKKNKASWTTISFLVMIFALIFFWVFRVKTCNPFKNSASKKIWLTFFWLITTVIVFMYGVDFEHYDYLHQRLNASVLNYAADASISLGMVWQTYPVIKIILLIIITVILFNWIIYNSYKWVSRNRYKENLLLSIIFFLLMGLAIFGRLSQYPLRWSDAFAFGDDFKANLSLNPVQSFFSTLQFRHADYDEKKVRSYYPLMAAYLGVQQPDSSRLNYNRTIDPSRKIAVKPNIVLVICESFSGYKSSMWGNPLNTTPFFKNLCDSGIFFDHCFTPAYGTARGVWAVITGVPDVESPRTASRNPAAVDQHTLIDDFKEYQKYYFLGGSTSWANIRALLTFNIRNLHLFEDGSYKAKSVDVWGISDKHLFLEANETLKKQQGPFFAVIQTADNHRPYTIPKEDLTEFSLSHYSKDSLNTFGFDNNDELNAFRYTDFCFQKFIQAAEKESYFNNTIFVFVGDHGIPGNAGNMFPVCWTKEGITSYHVPLLFYGPRLLQPNRITATCSQIDILPTVASLINETSINTALGRNLLDTSAQRVKFQNRAFLFHPDGNKIGMMTDEYCYMKELLTGKEDFVSAKNDKKLPDDSQTVSDKKLIQDLTNAYYQTGKYLLLNNKKRQSSPGK